MKKKRKQVDSNDSPYDLSIKIKRKRGKFIDRSCSPYDLSEIDMEERREFFAKNRYRL